MPLLNAFLWPGTKICQLLKISPEADEAGLARSMFNTIIYLVIGLAGLLIFV